MSLTNSGTPARLKLALIDPGYNPRTYFDPARHQELVTSIGLRGLLQAILVRPSPKTEGRYERVAGDRRYRACLEVFAPEGEIPVIIREMTDQEALEAAIDENDVRDDVSETEQADAAVRALAACNSDRAEASRRLGWSLSKFDRRIALAGLTEQVKTALNERRIKIGHAELLAAVAPDKQDRALETILASGIDVNKTRELLMKATQSLEAATFDKAECTTCPFNSASQRALFDTHVGDGHCTNSSCYQLKNEHAAKVAEEARQAAADEAAKAATLEEPATPEAPNVGIGEAANDDSNPAGDQRAQSSSAPVPAPTVVKNAAPAASTAAQAKPSVTVEHLSRRTKETREKIWRSTVARFLAEHPDPARQVVTTAGMTGKLSELRSTTMPARARILVSQEFSSNDFTAALRLIRDLNNTAATTALSAIAAGWIMDTLGFRDVAAIAQSYDITLYSSWKVDDAFLKPLTKDELKFIAGEVGLIEHMGAKAFAKLKDGKKDGLINGMLHAQGFNWAGLVPSCMSLNGKFERAPGGDNADASLKPNGDPAASASSADISINKAA